MNPPLLNQITVHFSGQITVSREKLKMLLSDEICREIPPNNPDSSAKIKSPENTKNQRLAYTMRETAEILGISYISVHRLLKRGLLKNSKVMRNIIIPATEIERFLRETL